MPVILANLTADTARRVYSGDLGSLEALGEVIRFDPKADDAAAFPSLLARADAVLTGWGSRRITAEELAARPPGKPLLVAHSAGSIRNLVAKELLGPTLRLTQSAAGVAPAVAQYTVALMVMAARQAMARSDALRRGGKYAGQLVYQDLSGLTIGLVGLSQVGRRVPPVLAPFGVGEILAYDPYAPSALAESLGVTLTADLDDLVARSDILSLHAPVTEETRNLIDARRVGLLKTGACFINTARPALVDQAALFVRAKAGEIQAYLDVTDPEPLPPDHEGWTTPSIFITPHIAGPTRQTLERIGAHAVAEIARFLRGEPLETEVTAERYDLLA